MDSQNNKKMADYVDNLQSQIQESKDKRMNRNRMTRTEKRINYDNLQVSPKKLVSDAEDASLDP